MLLLRFTLNLYLMSCGSIGQQGGVLISRGRMGQGSYKEPNSVVRAILYLQETLNHLDFIFDFFFNATAVQFYFIHCHESETWFVCEVFVVLLL